MIPNAIKNIPPPFLLHLQTGEELRAWLLKNDLLTEKVFFEGGIRFGEDGGGDCGVN